MECDQREAVELAASLATERAGPAPFQRKRDDSSPPQTTRIPTREFREPNPKCNSVQEKDIVRKQGGEKRKTDTESKGTQNT